jgi:hypothetical protein
VLIVGDRAERRRSHRAGRQSEDRLIDLIKLPSVSASRVATDLFSASSSRASSA